MKTLFALTLAISAFATAAAQATPVVNGARYNAATQSIDVDISYGGGCEDHKFKLEVGGCLESYPVRCSAEIKDVTGKPDFCEAFISQTVSFGLAEYGLNDSYYERASLTINGANGSKASITLP